MSPQWIEVDDDVMAMIKAQAEPFVDSPNDALHRLLGLEPAESACAPLPSTRPLRKGTRAASGGLLPLAEYELPLLRALSQLGGSAPVPRVRDAVATLLAAKLTDLDRQPLQSGEVRWENRLGFARMKATDRGHVRSPWRGTWELTEAGIEELGRQEADAQREGEASK